VSSATDRADNDEVSSLSRVRVWFGRHAIATYTAGPDDAERYASAMAQRFAGLRITIDDQPSHLDPLLPERVWWDRAPLRQR
jgi:hypothetical protein